MALKLDISIAGDQQLKRALGVRLDKVDDLRPAWDEVDAYLNKLHVRRFKHKGAIDGLPKWAALSKYTRDRKPPHLRDKPLILTGRLLRSLSNSKSSGALREKKKHYFKWGVDETRVPYAGKHQTGEPPRLPQRKPINLANKHRRQITRIINDFLHKTNQFERGAARAP